MSFRRRNRGNKIKQLIEQEKEENMEEMDEFWLGNTYFGCICFFSLNMISFVEFEEVQEDDEQQLGEDQAYSLE